MMLFSTETGLECVGVAGSNPDCWLVGDVGYWIVGAGEAGYYVESLSGIFAEASSFVLPLGPLRFSLFCFSSIGAAKR